MLRNKLLHSGLPVIDAPSHIIPIHVSFSVAFLIPDLFSGHTTLKDSMKLFINFGQHAVFKGHTIEDLNANL